ncbi:MAG: Rrf2 family transcriptional regulator, partial [Bacteroidales bacterium]|nr:Rrf2 family transcriptional regulator [Bacteroidales bacterium]
MLTQKTRYSMLALIKLAQEYGKGAIPVCKIAESEKIPKRFLESILLDLKNNGYLGSALGKNGGYYLVKHPKDISLLEIIRLFEGTIAWIACTSEKYYQPCEHCKDEQNCKIRHTFNDIRAYTYKKLAQTSILSLTENEEGREAMR